MAGLLKRTRDGAQTGFLPASSLAFAQALVVELFGGTPKGLAAASLHASIAGDHAGSALARVVLAEMAAPLDDTKGVIASALQTWLGSGGLTTGDLVQAGVALGIPVFDVFYFAQVSYGQNGAAPFGADASHIDALWSGIVGPKIARGHFLTAILTAVTADVNTSTGQVLGSVALYSKEPPTDEHSLIEGRP